MEKLNNVPVLRFPEFNSSWEVQSIGDGVDFLSGYPFDGDDIVEGSGDVLLMRGANITEGRIRHGLDVDRYFRGDIAKLSKYLLNEGDIVIGMDGSKVGKNSALVTKSDANTLLVQRVARLRHTPNCSLEFIFQHINSVRFYSYVDKVKTSSGIPHVSARHIKEFEVFMPSLPEQQKIASFLTSVDSKIQQLSKKKALLEQYKKGVMQQLFSQKLRFKDDQGNAFPDWEQKDLRDIITRFIVPMRDKPTDLTGPIPWCRIEDFDGKYLRTSKSGQGVTEDVVKAMNLKVYPVNTLIVSCSANLGFCAIVKAELITNQTFIGLVPDAAAINVEFLYYVMILASRRLNVLSSGTTISYLSRQQFEAFDVEIPSIKEQTKIASFLSAIDNKINGVTQQIDHTRQFKKGLLQQMFV